MARRFSTPKGDGNQTVPITARRIKRATLDKVKAFITEDDVKDDDGNITGTKMRPKLALYWNSGFIQRNKDNDPVYDADGNEQTHHIVDGFLAVSGFRTSNMVKNVLPALGIEGDAFIHPDGEKKGNLKDDEFGFAFGTNALGEDFSGIQSLEDLPEYKRGGKARKGEVECDVTSWMVYDEDGNGYELIGRAVELELTVDGDWNRIKSYMLPEDFEGLEAEGERAQAWLADLNGTSGPSGPTKPKPPVTPAPAKGKAKANPLADAHAFVTKTLDAAGVEAGHRAAVIGVMLHGDGHYLAPHDMDLEQCKQFRSMTNVGKDLAPVQAAAATVTEDQFPSEEDLPW